MKINEKIISIPPYISTHWGQISAIHMKGASLAITLNDGDGINIPNLTADTIDTIFRFHAEHLDSQLPSQLPFPFASKNLQKETSFKPFENFQETSESPFRLAFGSLEGGVGSALQHNPAQANSPDLPPEILQKISAIAKIISPEDAQSLPKAEPNCNCFHCQIAKAMSPVQSNMKEEPAEEIISDEELQFQQWEIQQAGDKLFTVINRLDSKERYSVFLGHPVGCTCGKQGCEHMVAVLKS